MAVTLMPWLRELSIFKPKEERFMIFGNDSSGKTTLLYRLKLNELVTTISTIGFNIETVSHKRRTFSFWDVGGCHRLRPLWRLYIANDTNTIYLHNPVDERVEESLECVRDAATILQAAGGRRLLIVFSKQDLLPPEHAEAIVADHRARFEAELEAYAPDLDWQYVDLPGLSAMTGHRCRDLLNELHRSIASSSLKSIPSDSSCLVEQKAKVPEVLPSESDLIALIESDRMNDLNAEEFWTQLISGEIVVWNHRSRLRAGYFLVLDMLKSGQSIFDAANALLGHLRRLKVAAPTRSLDTDHRTMTIFWLYNLQLATLNFKIDENLEKWPDRDSFDEMLLRFPYLMNSGLWKQFYTQDLIMSPVAKQYWQLPDLQTLPDFVERTATQTRRLPRLGQEDEFRLMRFGFAVVRKYMTSNAKRGWLVKQSLAALQTTTMRLRASNSDIQPYSETKAYFWIQVIHAALSGAHGTSEKDAIAGISLSRLSFTTFRVLFDMNPSIWRKHYTTARWNSVEARAGFLLPDLEPLPNVIPVPSKYNIMQALDEKIGSSSLRIDAEIPSMEELAIEGSVLLHEVDELKGQQKISPDVMSHAEMLYFIYSRIRDSLGHSSEGTAAAATTAMMDLGGIYADTLTLKAFWVQQIQQVLSKSEESTSFDTVVRMNPYLAYSDLPLCYYSQEFLQSPEARQRIVAPDRRKLKVFLPVVGSQDGEDDWILI